MAAWAHTFLLGARVAKSSPVGAGGLTLRWVPRGVRGHRSLSPRTASGSGLGIMADPQAMPPGSRDTRPVCGQTVQGLPWVDTGTHSSEPRPSRTPALTKASLGGGLAGTPGTLLGGLTGVLLKWEPCMACPKGEVCLEKNLDGEKATRNSGRNQKTL